MSIKIAFIKSVIAAAIQQTAITETEEAIERERDKESGSKPLCSVVKHIP